MTKTEAADTLATDVVVFARRYGVPVTKDLVEARMSEAGGGHLGDYYKEAAQTGVSYRTILRLAKQWI